MRMVEAFSKMITRIIGLKEKGQLSKAESLIMEAYYTILKIDPKTLQQFSEDDWEKLCKKRSREELEMIAELLMLEGEIRIDAGNPEGVCHLLLKSLELLRTVESQSDTFSMARFNRISSLEEKLSGADY